MDILFVAGVAVITRRPTEAGAFFRDTLGLPLHPPQSEPDGGYLMSDTVAGTKHFGVWPLPDAAQACFGTPTWPATHPVPQASLEFEVADVAVAAAELEAAGHVLLHGARTEPWGQVVARLQTADGVVVGVCHTPWLHEPA